MTTLEIILIAILWILLGCRLAYQDNKKNEYPNDDNLWLYFWSILSAPLYLVMACINIVLIKPWPKD